jgi:spore coat protein CotH
MKASRLWVLALFISILGAVLAPSALADPAEEIYDPSTVVFIDLTLSAEEKAKLEAEPEEYVKGTFSLTKSSDGTPAGEEPAPAVSSRPVEVRLKGSVGGSFRDLTEKAAFKLKFKKADAVLGLRKMTLNNMVQDRSMIHETLAYASFRAAGVPASRTGYAYVRLNGEDFGLYLNLENLDDIGLARIFGEFDDEAQHLYEGEYGDDVVPGGAGDFEVDEGSEDEIGDLEALIGAVNGSGADSWSSRVAPYADLTEMTKMWAVEKYIDHWDGYSGHAIPGLRPNNYYLYSEPSGRFQMLPWGTDQAWIPTIGVGTPGREVTFDGEGGVLFNKCLEDAACRVSYWEALLQATSSIAAIKPSALAFHTASLLAPWQELEGEESTRGEHDNEEIEDGVAETLDFIATRPVEANEWLAANVPPVKPTPVTSQAPSSRPATTAAPAGPLLFFLRSKQSPGFLSARLYLAEPGLVSVKARMKTAKGMKTICADHQRLDRPGPVALHCKLSTAALHRLARHALPLRLKMQVALPDGRLETIFRQISLQRG